MYDATEVAVVNRIVKLAHGKGEKAGRDQWNAIARARHNRNENGGSEPALDLLEKYLREGRNLTPSQASRWSGEYPLSVLEDAMKKLAPRLQQKDAPAPASAYPSIKYREPVERIIHDIGMKGLTCDPPYYARAERLYLNTYGPDDHVRVAKLIQTELRQPWIVSYDAHAEIQRLYRGRRKFLYSIQYSAMSVTEGREIFIFSDAVAIPSTSTLSFVSSAIAAAGRRIRPLGGRTILTP